jgi:hypothetical protein
VFINKAQDMSPPRRHIHGQKHQSWQNELSRLKTIHRNSLLLYDERDKKKKLDSFVSEHMLNETIIYTMQ